jgi:hypothetical protein
LILYPIKKQNAISLDLNQRLSEYQQLKGKITREQLRDYMKAWRAEHPMHGDQTPGTAPTETH